MAHPESVDLLIQGGTIVTMDREKHIFENGALAIRGSQIYLIGPSEEVASRVHADRMLDVSGQVILPGLVNTHGHWAMTLFRGLVDDRPLEAWLGTIWKKEAAFCTEENVVAGSQLAIIEMIRSGTTCAADMYWQYEANTAAAVKANFRTVNGPSFAKIEGIDELGLRFANIDAYLEHYCHHPLVHPCVQMHALYTVDAQLMEKARSLAEKYNLVFITHASESHGEMESIRQMYNGRTPIEALEDYGLLGPRTLLAHCVHLSDRDIERLVQTGASVSHCPSSNYKLSSGIARVADMLSAGINVALGTDGPASNNDLDMFHEAQIAALVQKAFSGDPAILPAKQVCEMLTINGARALGIDQLVGSLEPGKLADIAILDFDQPHLIPCYDIYSHLVYAVGKSDVRHVIINGQIVMEERNLLSIDEQEVKQKVLQIGKKIHQHS